MQASTIQLCKVNTASPVPVFQQIANQIIFAVADGRLGEGAELPTHREIAEQCEVNPNTAAKVIRDLKMLKIVDTSRGNGASVAKGAKARALRSAFAGIEENAGQVAREACHAGMSKTALMDVIKTEFENESESIY